MTNAATLPEPLPEPQAPLPLPPANATLAQRLLWGAEHLGGKRALAAAAHISEAQLYRYLEGESAIPHDKLEALAKAFGADPAWLLTGRGGWQMPINRPRPEFRGQLLQDLEEQLSLLLVEYQRSFPPPFRSRMIRYLYEILRFEEIKTNTLASLDKFKLLQYVSFLAEMHTEAEFDVLRQAFEVLEYQGLQPNLREHHQLLTTWCNLLARGIRGYYNSHAGHVYFERMGQNLPPHAIAELHGLVELAIQQTGKKNLDWLDVGCGNGRHLAHLHKFMPNLKLHGLELSDQGVKLCQQLERSERLPLGCVQQGDIRLAPYPANSFDVAFAHLSLMEVPYLPDLKVGMFEIFEELKRIIRPQGTVITVLPFGNGYDFKLPRQQYNSKFVELLAKQSGWEVIQITSPTDKINLSSSSKQVPESLIVTNDLYLQVILRKPKD